jgi:hypothetical protein
MDIPTCLWDATTRGKDVWELWGLRYFVWVHACVRA